MLRFFLQYFSLGIQLRENGCTAQVQEKEKRSKGEKKFSSGLRALAGPFRIPPASEMKTPPTLQNFSLPHSFRSFFSPPNLNATKPPLFPFPPSFKRRRRNIGKGASTAAGGGGGGGRIYYLSVVKVAAAAAICMWEKVGREESQPPYNNTTVT